MHGILGRGAAAGAEAADSDATAGYDLRAALGLVRRQIRLIAIVTVGCLLLALALLWQIEPLYRATATLLIDQRQAQLLELDTTSTNLQAANALIDTEVEILRSANVTERAIRRLDLARAREFRPREPLWHTLWAQLGAPAQATAEPEPRAYDELDPRDQAGVIRRVSDNVRVLRRGMTNVIAISAVSPSPERAAELANTVAASYLDEIVEARVESTGRVVSFLESRVRELGQEIGEVEDQIDGFVESHRQRAGTETARNELEALANARAEESGRREDLSQGLSALEAALRERDFRSLPAAVVSAETLRLHERHTALAGSVDTPDGDASGLRAELEAVEAELAEAARRDVASLGREIEAAEQRGDTLTAEMRGLFVEAGLSTDMAVPLYALQRDAEATRALYDTYLARLRDLQQRASLDTAESRVISAARPPREPAFPPSGLILAGSLACALGLGLGCAFLRENYIGGFTSPGQVEGVTGLAVLAEIPRSGGRAAMRTPDMAVVEEPLSSVAEAMRRLRIGVEALAGERERLTVMFTSAEAGEGKSTLALGFARAMAMSGRKTLLIDADLRRPSLHSLLDYTPSHGLIDFLLRRPNADGAGELVAMSDEDTGLEIILGSGDSRVATDTLLASQRFAQLMALAREHHEVVVLDAPPVGLVVDPVILGRQADIAVFVVQWAAIGQSAVKAGVKALDMVPALKVAAALNQVDERSLGRYGARSYYYRGSYRD